MTPERWAEIEHAFDQVADLPPGERTRTLRAVCAADDDLHAQVRGLLDADDAADRFIERAAFEDAEVFDDEDLPAGTSVGAYRILHRLGAGGMGVVYLAERADRTFDQQVAIKVLRAGVQTTEHIRRFHRERQVLARLVHPGVVRIYDGGTLPNGRPYLVMEHVDGEPIDRFCERRALDVPARLRLFIEVCAAVQAAHGALIVHRDLKPSNILVRPDGSPVLLDFGIAKSSDRRDHATVDMQRRPFTPEYASPEQVRGELVGVTSDVYSLGVILYQLLTGARPHRITTMTPAAVERAVCDETPTRPSLAVPDARRRRRLSGDLDNIVLLALRKEPDRRYGSARELADDLERHLAGLPVRARRESMGYVAAKFVGRRQPLVAALLLIAVTLVASTIVSADFWRRSVDDRILAERERDAAAFLTYAAHIAAAQSALRAGDLRSAAGFLARTDPAHRGWEYRYLERRLVGPDPIVRADGWLWAAVWTADGETLLLAGPADGGLACDVDSSSVQRLVDDDLQARSIAHDPSRASVFIGDYHGGVRRLHADGTTVWAVDDPDGDRVNELAIEPRRGRLAVARSDRTEIRSLDDGRLLSAPIADGGGAWSVAFSPDGARLYVYGRDCVVRVLDCETRTVLASHAVHTAAPEWRSVHSLGFALSPDGRRLAAARHDGPVLLLDADSLQLATTLSGHADRVRAIDFSPDGARLATGSEDCSLRIWDATTGLEKAVHRGHRDAIFGVAYAPDGTRLATVSRDRTARLWPTHWNDDADRLRDVEHAGTVSIDLSPDGARLASGAVNGTVRLWEQPTGRLLRVFRDHANEATTVRFSHDGDALITASLDGAVMVHDLDRDESRRIEIGAAVAAAVVDPRGEGFAVLTRGGRLLAFADAQAAPTVIGDFGSSRALAIDPSGRRYAVGDVNGNITLIDARTRAVIASAATPDGRIWRVAFNAAGDRLVSAGGRHVRLWDATTLAPGPVLAGHSRFVRSARFSPDGTRIASIGHDRTVRLWDARQGVGVLTLQAHNDWAFDVAFTPDGDTLLSAGRSIRYWEAEAPSDAIRNARIVRADAEDLLDEPPAAVDQTPAPAAVRAEAQRLLEVRRR